MGMMPMYWRWLQVRQILSAEKCMLNNTSMRHAAAGTLCISIKVVPTIWLCKHTMHECSQQTAALTPCTTKKGTHAATSPPTLEKGLQCCARLRNTGCSEALLVHLSKHNTHWQCHSKTVRPLRHAFVGCKRTAHALQASAFVPMRPVHQPNPQKQGNPSRWRPTITTKGNF
jgi:hypothetical protein